MADALGLFSHLAMFKTGVTAWTTAHPGGTGDRIHFNSETLSAKYAEIQKAALVGFAGREPSEFGNLEAKGNTVHELDYDNFDPLLECFFGAVAGRVFTLTDDEVAKYYWLELEKTVERWRFGACKANKISIKGPENEGLIMLEVEHIARLLARTATALSADSIAVTGRVLFKQLRFRIGDQVDALGAGDEVKISSFDFSANRGLKADDWTNGATGIYIEEPVPAVLRECNINIALPRYNAANDLFRDWYEAGSNLQAELYFDGGASGTMKIELPEVQISEGPDVPVEGPAPLKQDLKLRCFRNVNNTPMAAVTKECRITMT